MTKTDRELELEEKIHILTESQMKNENTIGYLATKLEIAVKALEKYANEDNWEDTYIGDRGTDLDYIWCEKGGLCTYGYLTAQQALKEIEE